jgi:hypothetical protein
MSNKSHKTVSVDEYVSRKRVYKPVKKGQPVDDDSDDEAYLGEPVDPSLTPMTKRRVREENYKESVKKLGSFATFMTLIKAFICTAVLYLPKSFVNGGWGF